MFVWQAHEGAVTSLAFGPDGRFLVSVGTGDSVKMWDPLTGAEQLSIPFQTFQRESRFLVVSGDGTAATVAEHNRGVTFLDLIGGVALPTDAPLSVTAAKRTPDGQSVVVIAHEQFTSHSPRLLQYGFADLIERPVPLKNYSSLSRALAFSPDGSRLAIGRGLFAWPPAPNRHAGFVHTKDYEPEDLAFSADNEHLFALVGGKVVVYSLVTCIYKTKLKGHCGPITAMQLAPDGRHLWTASRDATVKCWDTFSLSLDRTYRFDTGGLDCLAVSPDGNVAAVGSAQKGTITMWDLN